jgi:hypothetical protein
MTVQEEEEGVIYIWAEYLCPRFHATWNRGNSVFSSKPCANQDLTFSFRRSFTT